MKQCARLAAAFAIASLIAAPVSGQESWSLRGNASTDPQADFLGTIDNRALAFRTDNQERLRVDAAGNVGIGDAAPRERLTVRGNILLPASTSGLMGGNGSLRFPSDLGDGSGGAQLGNIGSIDLIIDSDDNNTSRSLRVMANGTDRGSAQTLFMVDEQGRVGIGTTRPSNALTVQGSTFLGGETRTTGKLGIGAPAGEATLLIREPSPSADAVVTLSAGGSWPLILRQTSGSQFTIENGGKKRLGIGEPGLEVYTENGWRSV